MILELKHVREERQLSIVGEEAVEQVITRKYDSWPIYHGYKIILQYALSFWNKRAVVEKVERQNRT